jgi:hypothetical protein
MLDSNNTNNVTNIERRLSEALNGSDVGLERIIEAPADDDLSSRELLQMAWDRAEQEIDELRTELRILQQRHREAERHLISRINDRKRLQRQILESADETAQAV